MDLQIGQALGRGTRRSFSLSGIVLLVAMALYQVVFVGAMNTVILNNLPSDISPEQVGIGGLSFPVSTPIAAALGVVAILFGTAIFLIAARLLSRDVSELGSLPAGLITHRFGRAFLATLAASIILGIAIPIGFVAFVIPGVFLAVSLQFTVYAIAVEDCGPIAALRRSWELATGNRWRLLALIVLIAVISGFAGGIGSLLSIASPTAGQLGSMLFSSVALIVTYGILADAFVQLRGETVADDSTATTAL